jgi:hypothetical protein
VAVPRQSVAADDDASLPRRLLGEGRGSFWTHRQHRTFLQSKPTPPPSFSTGGFSGLFGRGSVFADAAASTARGALFRDGECQCKPRPLAACAQYRPHRHSRAAEPQAEGTPKFAFFEVERRRFGGVRRGQRAGGRQGRSRVEVRAYPVRHRRAPHLWASAGSHCPPPARCPLLSHG